MRGFTHYGKQVRDTAGVHFADAATEVGAALICAALNYRHHRPVIADGEVICARCQAALPGDGDDPCVPKTPRCDQTPDLFEDNADPQDDMRPVRPTDDGGTEQRPAVRDTPRRSPTGAEA